MVWDGPVVLQNVQFLRTNAHRGQRHIERTGERRDGQVPLSHRHGLCLAPSVEAGEPSSTGAYLAIGTLVPERQWFVEETINCLDLVCHRVPRHQ